MTKLFTQNIHTISLLGAALLAGTASLIGAAPSSATELKLATFIPPQHHLHRNVFTGFVKEIEQASGGALTVKIFPSGQLGKGPVQQYKRVAEGITEIGFICYAFNANVFPKTLLTFQVGSARSAVDATKRLNDIFDEHLADEFTRVRNLSLFTVAQAVIISRTKPVHSLADMKGAKVLTPGTPFKPLVEAWGGSPVSMSLGDMYNAVSTGVVDMVTITGSGLVRPWNLNEVSKHVSVGLPGLIAPCGLAINPKSWDGLNTAQKSALTKTTGRGMALRAAKSFDDAADAALAGARKNPKITVVKLSEAMRKQFFDRALVVANKHIADLEKKGSKNPRGAYEALNR